MISTLMILSVTAIGPAPDASVKVTATLDAETLDTGDQYDIVVDIDFGEGRSASGAGIPAPILQIDVPESIKLIGEEITGHRALAKNEFLQEPYERLLKKLPARIPIQLVKTPEENDRVGLNVIAYVGDDTASSFFVRRRIDLPLAPNATAPATNPSKSDWGKNKTLQIGDKAQEFKLPTAAGSKVALKDYLGEKNVIVTTYRAFW